MTSPTLRPDTVSIIIPVFDRATLIGEAVASALAQTHAAIEIVIVDDGSTDGTGVVVDRLAEGDRRITALHQPNRGPSAARNAGVAASSGEWICFLDSDDLMRPDRVAHQLAIVRACDQPVVCIGQQLIEIAEGVAPPPTVVATMSIAPPWWYSTTMLLRRTVYDDVGGFDESLRLHEDIDLLMRLQRAGVPLVTEPGAITIRRVFGDNLVYQIESSEKTMLDLLRRNRPHTP